MRYNVIVALALFLEMRKEFKVDGQKSKRQRMWQGYLPKIGRFIHREVCKQAWSTARKVLFHDTGIS